MKKTTFILTLLFIVLSMMAKVRLPRMFSDGMVMQRNCDARVWGTADKQTVVKIKTSWNNRVYTVKADAEGKWQTSVKTPDAGGPYSLTFDDGSKLILKNVLIGEVWICSGQSNMEMPMKGFKNQPVDNAVADILHSTDAQLRLFTVKRNSRFAPVDTVNGSWQQAAPASVREFSATAYYFGRELRQTLGVPVGLIVTAWGRQCVRGLDDCRLAPCFPRCAHSADRCRHQVA
jgi:sialate O-acetylesterase